MMAIAGSVAGLATARPGTGASGPDAVAADPGGFDEVFSEGGAGTPERSGHRARSGDEDEVVPTGDAPAVANAPPEQVRLPGEPKGMAAAEAIPEAAGMGPPTGLPGGAALADPAGVAADVPTPADQPLADGGALPEGQIDLGKALTSNGDGADEALVMPDVVERPPPEAEAKPEAAAEPAQDGPKADESPAASPAATTRPDRMEAAVSAVAEALRPQKSEAPQGPAHGRHRRGDAVEPESDRAASSPSRPAQEPTEAARPAQPPGQSTAHEQPRSPDRHPFAEALTADPLAPGSDPRAAAEARAAPGHITRALHQLPDGFTLRLAPHLPQRGGRAVEITLTPEELGKVRMQVALSGDALTLTIAAHRPETLDLLRSHIDQLAREFRDLGFDRLEFGFARDQGQENLAGQGGGPGTRQGDPPEAVAAPPPLSAPGRPARDLAVAGAGLDLRL